MIAIGDIAEKSLRALGITKEMVSGIAGKDCGCAERQESLNRFGYRWQHRLAVLIRWLRYRWQAIRYSMIGQRIYMACRHFCLALRVLFVGR